jgi:hypothetical protein
LRKAGGNWVDGDQSRHDVMATRKYNPGFMSDDELVASFCVRACEFESISETLRENTGNLNQHLIVIGPRGSGKTSLLLRVAVEVRRRSDLSAKLFPITFAEESYEVGSCGEFWLECLRIPVKKATHSGNKKPPGGWSNPDTATIAGWLF